MPVYGRKRKLFNWEDTNWCGSRRSDGKWTSNRCGFAPAVSSFDQACKDHDCNLSRGMDEAQADLEFAGSVDNPIVGYGPYVYHKFRKILSGNNKLMDLPTPNASQAMEQDRKSTIFVDQHDPSNPSAIHHVGEKKLRPLSGSRKTTTYLWENGGTAVEIPTPGTAISSTLFFGHSTYNRTDQAIAIWASIVKKLFEKAGFDIPALDYFVTPAGGGGATYTVQVRYSRSTLAPLETFTTANTNTVNDAATLINIGFQTLSAGENLTFSEAILRWTGADATPEPLATMNLSRLVINQLHKSHLTLQNVTPAAAGSESTEVLSTNPLKFMKYYCKSPVFNIASFQNESNPLASVGGLGRPDADQKIVFFNQNAAFSSNQKSYLREIVNPSNVIDCVAVGKGVLQPGAIMHSNVAYKSGIYLNTFYSQHQPTGLDQAPKMYGNCEVFCLEKVIDSRSESTPPVVVWEIRHSIVTSLTYGKTHPTVPFKSITSSVY